MKNLPLWLLAGAAALACAPVLRAQSPAGNASTTPPAEAESFPSHLKSSDKKSRVLRSASTPDGKYRAEIRSTRGDDMPNETRIITRGRRKTQRLVCETYIHYASFSPDGRYLYLHYHVSSGNFDEMFRRDRSGNFQHLLGSGDMAKLVAAGKVPGLSLQGLGNASPQDMEGYLEGFPATAGAPLPFHLSPERSDTVWARLLYDPERRRVVAWERTLLEKMIQLPDLDTQLWQRLSLEERSGSRALSLIATRDRAGRPPVRETLITFAPQPVAAGAKSIQLQSADSPAGKVTFSAEEITPRSGAIVSRDWVRAVWTAKLTGSGKKFRLLEAKLARLRADLKLTGDDIADWPEAASFQMQALLPADPETPAASERSATPADSATLVPAR